jgi:heat shock protein 110kDa
VNRNSAPVRSLSHKSRYVFLGEWKVNDVKPSPSGEAQEVKVKVRIDQNGILLISSAQMVEKKEVQEEQNGENEPSPTGPTPDGQTPAGEPMDTADAVS